MINSSTKDEHATKRMSRWNYTPIWCCLSQGPVGCAWCSRVNAKTSEGKRMQKDSHCYNHFCFFYFTHQSWKFTNPPGDFYVWSIYISTARCSQPTMIGTYATKFGHDDTPQFMTHFHFETLDLEISWLEPPLFFNMAQVVLISISSMFKHSRNCFFWSSMAILIWFNMLYYVHTTHVAKWW